MPLGRRRPIMRAAAVGTIAYQGSKRGAMAGAEQAQRTPAARPPRRHRPRRHRTRRSTRSTSWPHCTPAVSSPMRSSPRRRPRRSVSDDRRRAGPTRPALAAWAPVGHRRRPFAGPRSARRFSRTTCTASPTLIVRPGAHDVGQVLREEHALVGLVVGVDAAPGRQRPADRLARDGGVLIDVGDGASIAGLDDERGHRADLHPGPEVLVVGLQVHARRRRRWGESGSWARACPSRR